MCVLFLRILTMTAVYLRFFLQTCFALKLFLFPIHNEIYSYPVSVYQWMQMTMPQNRRLNTFHSFKKKPNLQLFSGKLLLQPVMISNFCNIALLIPPRVECLLYIHTCTSASVLDASQQQTA